MSRIDKIPVKVPSDAEVGVDSQDVSVKGPKGTLGLAIATPITARVEGNEIMIIRADDERKSHLLHDSTRILVTNMTEGIIKGYAKILETQSIGYHVTQRDAAPEFTPGFSYPVSVKPPEGVTFRVEGNRVIVEGISGEQAGEIATNIRKIHPSGSYGGEGVRYFNKNVRRKVGKVGEQL